MSPDRPHSATTHTLYLKLYSKSKFLKRNSKASPNSVKYTDFLGFRDPEQYRANSFICSRDNSDKPLAQTLALQLAPRMVRSQIGHKAGRGRLFPIKQKSEFSKRPINLPPPPRGHSRRSRRRGKARCVTLLFNQTQTASFKPPDLLKPTPAVCLCTTAEGTQTPQSSHLEQKCP